MKEGGGSGGDEGGVSVTTGKRRWRNLVIGVLFVVIPSMVVPLAFLFGLHNGFHSPNPNSNGYVPMRKTSVPGDLKSYDKYENSDDTPNNSEDDRSTHINELVQILALNISKKSFFGTKGEKRNVVMKDVRNYVEETHAAAEGSKEVTHAPKDSSEASSSEKFPANAEEGNETIEDARLLAETEGSHNATMAPKVVSRRQIAVWVGVVVILIVTTLLALPEQIATLEAKVDELGEEIRKLTEEIGSDEEEITRERLTDQLERMDNLVSEGEDTLNEFEELVNSEGEAYNREHDLRLNVLRAAFNRLLWEIATWREVKVKHREQFLNAVDLWKWYYPKRDDGGNAELKLIIHHETSPDVREKMENTLEDMRNKGSIAADHVETSWEEAPKFRPDDLVRNFYK